MCFKILNFYSFALFIAFLMLASSLHRWEFRPNLVYLVITKLAYLYLDLITQTPRHILPRCDNAMLLPNRASTFWADYVGQRWCKQRKSVFHPLTLPFHSTECLWTSARLASCSIWIRLSSVRHWSHQTTLIAYCQSAPRGIPRVWPRARWTGQHQAST